VHGEGGHQTLDQINNGTFESSLGHSGFAFCFRGKERTGLYVTKKLS